MNDLAIRATTFAHERAFIQDLGVRTMMTSVSSVRFAPEAMVTVGFERLLEFVDRQPHVVLIAERDGARAGFLILLDMLPDEVTMSPQGFIAYMAVEPGEQRSGVARALLEKAEDEARRRNLPYMALMVTEDNTAARALYESAGYATERRLLCKEL